MQNPKPKRSFEQKMLAGFGLATALLVLSGLTAGRNAQVLFSDNALVAHSLKVLWGLEDLAADINTAESGQRGYVITEKEDFRKPYTLAVAEIDGDLAALEVLIADNSFQRQRLASLRISITNRLELMRRTMATLDTKGFPAARAQILEGSGKTEMDTIRRVISLMENDEKKLLTDRMDRSASSLVRTAVTIGAVLVSLVLLLALIFFFTKREMTNRRQAEAALQAANALQHAILNSANYSIISTDANGTIRLFNRTAERWLGYSAQEVVGKATPVMIHDSDEVVRRADGLSRELNQKIEPGFEVFVAKARLGPPDECEWTYLRKDGTRFPVLLSVTALRDSEGNPTGYVGVASDITERKHFEKALTEARDAALESARLKAEFLANMSHEIRTPMNGVIGMTHLLLDTPLSAQQREFAQTIEQSGETLLKIINDILDFSKIEAGKLDFETVDFDLRETVETALEIQAKPAQSKGLEIASLVYRDVPTKLRGDPGRLHQVLTNLVSNAIKFTAQGEVVIRATREAESESHAVIRFTVSDTGVGIPLEAQHRLFQAFAQADGSTTRKYGGTGLGLAISKQLVEMMAGQIGVESAPGKGSTFWFYARFEKQSPGSFPAPALKVTLEGLRILIVDDNPTNRQILRLQLQGWRFRDESASNAAEALEQLRRGVNAGDPFAAAILDMHMPEKNGLDLARAIKADSAISRTRLIMLSSVGQKLAQDELAAAGIEDCLLKPVRQSNLLNCLSRVLNGSPQPPPPPTDSSPSPATPVAESAAPSVPGRTIRILLAEDNSINQRVALIQLEKLGFAAATAANGIEALQAWEQTAPDVILMDCQMPEMDGYQTALEIRRREKNRVSLGSRATRTHIIAMTAHAMEGDREKCLAAGMDDYLAKPVRMDEMKAALERFRSKHAPDSARATPASAVSSGQALAADSHSIELEVSPATEESAIDFRRLKDLTEDDPASLRDVIKLYLGQADDMMQELSSAVQNRAAKKVQEVAHRLGGASSTCGVNAVVPSLRELENLAESGNLSGADALLDRTQRAFERVRESLHEFKG